MQPSSIYTCRWNDHSYSVTLGARVTVTHRDAIILIAFITPFDALVGAVVRNITAYFWYGWRARANKPRGGLYQQTVTLRQNSSRSLLFFRQITAIGLRWRGRTPWALLRVTPISLVALILVLTTAGILSSQIAIRDAHILQMELHVVHTTQPPFE